MGSLRVLRRAWLPDMEPCFHYRSLTRGGGALDVRACVGAVVPGMLFDADDDAWRALDLKEGVVAGRYARTAVLAVDDQGHEVRAITYRVQPQYVEVDARGGAAHVAPTDDYLEVVRRGLALHGLPEEPVLGAARNEPVPAVDAVFVYGTLMTGECREPILRAHSPLGVEAARVRGSLLDLGEYPGLVGGDAEVHGELWRFGDVAPLLAVLDEVEDFRGPGHPGSLYRRTVLCARTAEAEVLSWTYVYAGADRPDVIVSGSWRCR